mmetsp:Transcript_8698/g.25300  ORF Transcript_8698/g.25300 Transcript_8698/m.25300 type:complete len:222 (+) Transcript_8698:208-873(+)
MPCQPPCSCAGPAPNGCRVAALAESRQRLWRFLHLCGRESDTQERGPKEGDDEHDIQLVAHGDKLEVEQLHGDPEGPLRLHGVPERVGHALVHLRRSHALERAQDRVVVCIAEIAPVHKLLNEHLGPGHDVHGHGHALHNEPFEKVVVQVCHGRIEYAAEERRAHKARPVKSRGLTIRAHTHDGLADHVTHGEEDATRHHLGGNGLRLQAPLVPCGKALRR